MSDITQTIEDLITPPTTQAGYEIVAVEYNKPTSTLTIFIDKEGGNISLDDCEKVNNLVDPLLDELDPTKGKPYTLNVSSPGLDRKFIKDRDYQRNYNREVEVKLKKQYKKKFNLMGILLNKSENQLTIKIGDEEVVLDMEIVQYVHPAIKFK